MTMDEALLLAGPSPETGRAYTQQEFELRERLRWKPWNGAAGPFAVRRWLRPTGNWTAPDSPAAEDRSDPRRGIGGALSGGKFEGVTGEPGR